MLKEVAGNYGVSIISRRIAEEHHGRLWLESSSDAGSVFVLALPIAENGPTR